MSHKKQNKQFFVTVIINWSVLVGFGISLLISGSLYITNKDTAAEIQKIIFQVVLPTVLCSLIPIFIYNIPKYNQNILEEQIEELRKILDNELSKCPRITALHTDGDILKANLEKIDKAGFAMNLKWIMAKYVSKVLSVKLKDFTFRLEAPEYSQFATELIRESHKSIELIGSMSPIVWLHELTDNNEVEKARKFFNNNLDETFPINQKNHSLALNGIHDIDKKRFICLNEEDFKNLFTHELSLDMYHKFNEKITNYYINFGRVKEIGGTKIKDLSCDPLSKEYMICDGQLALEWNRADKTVRLSEATEAGHKLLQDLHELNKDLEKKSIEGKNDYCYTYEKLRKHIIAQKETVLKKCLVKGKESVPHKYAYLYPYTKDLIDPIYKNELYGDSVSSCLNTILTSYRTEIKNKIDIIDIGPGNGHRIHRICDDIGTKNINSYILVDYSPSLLSISESILRDRLKGCKPEIDIQTKQIDLCEMFTYEDIFRNNKNETIKGALVLIPANSSLFGHDSFDLKKLVNTHNNNSAIVTLDRYDPNTFFNVHLPVKEFLFSPLKIFEIPYDPENITESLFKQSYDDRNHIMRINFSLKEYLKKINKIKDHPIKTYNDERNKLYDLESVQLVSFLKFKTAEELKSHFSESFDIDEVNFIQDGNTFCFALKSKK